MDSTPFLHLVPTRTSDEEKSPPELDDDLNGYFNIYMASDIDTLLEDLEASEIKELSPDKVGKVQKQSDL